MPCRFGRARNRSVQYENIVDSDAPEKLIQEHDVLRRAAKIEDNRAASDSKRLDRRRSPPRNKTHWDYVLEEMVNVANERKESVKWKVQSAKRLGKAVTR